MAKTSAGLLMYRRRGGHLEVLLVHPGGPFWRHRDAGAWSIPKGELDDAEDPLECARREFEEETGLRPEGPFLELPAVRQKAGKVVQAWAFEGDWDPSRLRSNTFEIEWPPKSGKTAVFPEVDRAELLCPFGKRAGGQKNSGGSTRCASTAWTWRCFGRVLAGGVVGGEGQVREGAAEKGVSSTS